MAITVAGIGLAMLAVYARLALPKGNRDAR